MKEIVLDSPVDREVEVGGKRLLYFGGNDYLGLANHPDVLAGARDALGRFGMNSAASRETSGTSRIHLELEAALAEFCGSTAAAIFSSGYLAVIAIVQALRPDVEEILVDEKTHSSGRDAGRVSGLLVTTFPHRSPEQLEAQLARRRSGRAVLVLTDGVFPFDGAIAPLREYVDALGDRPGYVLVDDAHGFGVLGASGRGTAEECGVAAAPKVRTVATLSKAFGAAGGCVPCDSGLRARIGSAAAAYIGATPMPPPVAAAGLAAVRVASREPSRLGRLRENLGRVKEGLRALGIAADDSPAPIVSVSRPSRAEMERLRDALLDRGILVPLIRYAGGPREGAFRLTVSANHRDDDVDRLLEAWRAAL